MMFFILHGFGSATPNAKSEYFEKTFPNDTVINLNYNFDPAIGIGELDMQIDEAIAGNLHETEFVFVGTSLGGYYAQYLAKRFGGKAIMINPSINPFTTLSAYIGPNYNYATGEKFDFTKAMVERYNRYNISPGTVPTLVLLDMADEVIPADNTVKHFDGKAMIRTFEGGSHRFEHLEDATSDIISFSNDIVYDSIL